MNYNAKVETSYFRNGMNKYRLGDSYLINASSDKYREKRNGNKIVTIPFFLFILGQSS